MADETHDPDDETPERSQASGNSAASELPPSKQGDDSDASDRQGDAKPRVGRRPPAAGAGIVSPAAEVVQLRVATVARALVDGLGRAAILQAVATGQAKEAAARAKARQTGATSDVELRGLVPFVWGEKPIPERTIDAYIKRAKDMLAAEGRAVSRNREYVLAMNLARLNEVYFGAYKAGRFHTCLGVIKEVNAMFGMHEAIKVMLLTAERQHAETSSTTGNAHDLRTEEGRAAALRAVIEKAATKDPAVGKIFARFAHINDVPAPLVKQSSTPANGAKRSNGSNGHP